MHLDIKLSFVLKAQVIQIVCTFQLQGVDAIFSLYVSEIEVHVGEHEGQQWFDDDVLLVYLGQRLAQILGIQEALVFVNFLLLLDPLWIQLLSVYSSQIFLLFIFFSSLVNQHELLTDLAIEFTFSWVLVDWEHLFLVELVVHALVNATPVYIRQLAAEDGVLHHVKVLVASFSLGWFFYV